MPPLGNTASQRLHDLSHILVFIQSTLLRVGFGPRRSLANDERHDRSPFLHEPLPVPGGCGTHVVNPMFKCLGRVCKHARPTADPYHSQITRVQVLRHIPAFHARRGTCEHTPRDWICRDSIEGKDPMEGLAKPVERARSRVELGMSARA
jgi:hypothetical protein